MRGAAHYANHRADHRAEAVIERHRRADAIVLIGVEREPDRHAVVEQIAMGEHRPLGSARRSRGVLDIGDIVRLRRVLDVVGAAGDHRVPGFLAQPDFVLHGQARHPANPPGSGGSRRGESRARSTSARIRDRFKTYRSSCERYAGLTLTSTIPARAVAYCIRTHSTQLLAQMPARSPGRSPSPASPRATRVTSRSSSRQVRRIF